MPTDTEAQRITRFLSRSAGLESEWIGIDPEIGERCARLRKLMES